MKNPLVAASTAIAISVISMPIAFARQPVVLAPNDTLTTSGMPHRWQSSTLRNQNLTNASNAQNATVQAQMPTNTAKRPRCTGDAAKATPPIPNYPTHIRNQYSGQNLSRF